MAPTPASSAAAKTRALPTALASQVTSGCRSGEKSQARCTSTSTPARWAARSSRPTSAATHVVSAPAGSSWSGRGRRRATPTREVARSSAASTRIVAVPTLPVAPVTITRMGLPRRCACRAPIPGGRRQTRHRGRGFGDAPVGQTSDGSRRSPDGRVSSSSRRSAVGEPAAPTSSSRPRQAPTERRPTDHLIPLWGASRSAVPRRR